MNRYIIGGGIIVSIVLIMAFVAGMYVSYSNQEVRLRNLIAAKQLDNTNEFNNMWTKIKQVSQVTVKERETLSQVFNEYADARSTKSDQVVFNWIKESVPNVSNEAFINLQNTITSARDSWTMRQKEIIDYKREHDNLIDQIPSKWFVGKRGKVNIIIVTSTKTEAAFKTGKDDDINVF